MLPKAAETAQRILGILALAFLALALVLIIASVMCSLLGMEFPVILGKVMGASWPFCASAAAAWWALPDIFLGEVGSSGCVVTRAEHPAQFWFNVVLHWSLAVVFLLFGIWAFIVWPLGKG